MQTSLEAMSHQSGPETLQGHEGHRSRSDYQQAGDVLRRFRNACRPQDSIAAGRSLSQESRGCVVSVNWVAVEALGTIGSGMAILVSALLVLRQLREENKEEFITGTAATFTIWMDDDFQRAQQWILYELDLQTWDAFFEAHRGQYGERAFIRVGSFYNRIGYMVEYRMLGAYEGIIVDVIASSAIQVWEKMEPLILDARRTRNATLYQDFQRLLPTCYGRYIPSRAVHSGVQYDTPKQDVST